MIHLIMCVCYSYCICNLDKILRRREKSFFSLLNQKQTAPHVLSLENTRPFRLYFNS